MSTLGHRVIKSVTEIYYYFDEYIPSGEMRKLRRFYRPIIITECFPHWCYRVRDEKTDRILPFKIHASRLKSLQMESGLTNTRRRR